MKQDPAPHHRQRHGRGHRYPPEVKAEALRRLNNGETVQSIAALLDLGQQTVVGWMYAAQRNQKRDPLREPGNVVVRPMPIMTGHHSFVRSLSERLEQIELELAHLKGQRSILDELLNSQAS